MPAPKLPAFLGNPCYSHETRAVAEQIIADSGTRELKALRRTSRNRWHYLIETTHSFPRFTIGDTNADCSDVRLIHRCGQEANSLAEFINIPPCIEKGKS